MRRIRPLVAAVAIVFQLLGCYSWKPSRVSPEQELTTRSRARIRVVTTAGVRYVVLRPVVDADSIRGIVAQARSWGYDSTTIQAIALADVRRIEVRRVHLVGTVAGTLLGLVAIGALGFVAVCGTSDCFSW